MIGRDGPNEPNKPNKPDAPLQGYCLNSFNSLTPKK